MPNEVIEQIEQTHIVVNVQTKKIMDEVKKNSGITLSVITEKALRHGLKVLFKNHLSEETLEQLNNVS